MAIKSAIVPYQANKSSVMVQPQQSMSAIVPVQKETAKKAEVTARDVRASVLRLLRKRQQRDRLEAKYYKLEKTLNERQKARKEEAKNENNSFLGKVGSGFRNRAKKAGGDLLGSIGKLLGFLALDWISKPENQAILKGIVDVTKGIFQFIDWWVTGSVDNLLTGFSEMVGGDSLLERFVGFIKVVTGILGLRYFLKPGLLFKDFNTIKKAIQSKGFRKLNIFFKKWQKQGAGKALKFAFPKIATVLSSIKTSLASKISGSGVGKLMEKIITMIRVQLSKRGAGALKPLIKKIVKGPIQFINKIPIVGPLIGAGINVALGDPWDKAIIKALGASLGQWLGAGLGTLIFPGIGTFVGGFLGNLIGDWLGGRIYDMITGKNAPPPTEEEKKRLQIVRDAMDKNYDEMSESEKAEYIARIAKKNKLTVEQVKTMLEKKATDPDTTSDGNPPVDTTEITGGLLKGLTKDDYRELAFIVSGEAQRGTKDEYGVAANVLIRLASPNYPSTIKAVGAAPGQYEAVFKGKARYDDELAAKLESPEGQAEIVKALRILNGRTDFKGTSMYQHMGASDVKFSDRGNFYHYSSQMKKSDPVPSPIPNQEWKKFIGGQGGGLPKQIPSRHNRLSDVSMDVVQSKRRRPRKKVTVIVNNQGDTLISAQKVSMLGTLNSTNKPQLVKRGI